MNFSVIDYECKNWNEPLGVGYYNGSEYYDFDDTASLLNTIARKPREIIYAHNGGRFDFLFLFDSIMPFRDSVWTYPRNLLCINSSIASFDLFDCEFRDSLMVMPGSMARILPAFGLEKGEMDYQDIENQDWRPYMKQDCVNQWKALKIYFEYLRENFDIEPSLTIAATAMKIYRKHFSNIPLWKSYYEKECREAYLGGRCEIFKTKGTGLNCYDINSLYPYVMQSLPYPVGKPQKIQRNYKPVLAGTRLGIIKCKVRCPDMYVPLLPVREANKMLFCTGELEGSWTLTEIRWALDLGYEITDIEYIIYWPESRYIFKSWVDYTYNKRLESKSEAESYILKILMNSLYGKFGQSREKEEILFLGPNDTLPEGVSPIALDRGIFKRPKMLDSQFIMPHIAAHVTSYARIELYRYLNEATYYCDTDSNFTSQNIECSKKLGAMKLEERCRRAEFFLPKLYRTDKRIKAKGFRFNDRTGKELDSEAKASLFNRIIAKEEISVEKILSFKQCLAGKHRFSEKQLLTKSIRSNYDKRKVLENCDTRPYSVQEWRDEHDEHVAKRISRGRRRIQRNQ